MHIQRLGLDIVEGRRHGHLEAWPDGSQEQSETVLQMLFRSFWSLFESWRDPKQQQLSLAREME
jgi:hypothetical protein